jgi:hypothetical protein
MSLEGGSNVAVTVDGSQQWNQQQEAKTTHHIEEHFYNSQSDGDRVQHR